MTEFVVLDEQSLREHEWVARKQKELNDTSSLGKREYVRVAPEILLNLVGMSLAALEMIEIIRDELEGRPYPARLVRHLVEAWDRSKR